MDYYVYGHYDQDELVYVGYGKGGRAVKSEGRSKEHRTWMEEQIIEKCDFYNFFEKCTTRTAARQLEKELIKEHSPRFNVEYTPEWYEKQLASATAAGRISAAKRKRAVITPAGTFPSTVEAGKHYSVDQNTIRNRVKKCWEGYAYA